MKYVVQFSARVVRTVRLMFDAPDAVTAAKIGAERKARGGDERCVYTPEEVAEAEGEGEHVKAWDVVGRCEACKTPILEGHPGSKGAVYDEDGIWVCPEHAPTAADVERERAEAAARGEAPTC